MTIFFQSIIANSPVLVALTVLFFFIVIQGLKIRGEMRQGFKNVENEFKLVRSEMREGFLKVGHHLDLHDREIKRIKRRLKKNH